MVEERMGESKSDDCTIVFLRISSLLNNRIHSSCVYFSCPSRASKLFFFKYDAHCASHIQRPVAADERSRNIIEV